MGLHCRERNVHEAFFFQPPPPTPYEYSYAAGRHPGGKPDRYVEEEGDERGVVRGSYAYLDPNWKWQKVEYVADPETGFHVKNQDESAAAALPLDTAEVAKAKQRHRALFAAIAERHRRVNGAVAASAKEPPSLASQPQPQPRQTPSLSPYAVAPLLPHAPVETDAVKRKREEHAAAFRRIAEEHARIAAEQSRLSALAAQFGEIYD